MIFSKCFLNFTQYKLLILSTNYQIFNECGNQNQVHTKNTIRLEILKLLQTFIMKV